MLTKLTVRRFKRFDDVEIELGSPVVFVGPNDAGKTTALQALALWEIGLKRWLEKRGSGRKAPEKRFGVTINRRDLIAVPVPDAIFLWRNLGVRRAVQDEEGKRRTENIRVDIVVEGVSGGEAWTCGLEFDYANEESLYCRPLRLGEDSTSGRMEIPKHAHDVKIAFLPPMSGLAANETRLDPGAISVRVGEGRTAEVLRNLCHGVLDKGTENWGALVERIEALFGSTLDEPRYIPERGEITMTYKDRSGARLDLSSAGRGMQQTVLLLAHLELNPGSVLLLDEPDAHLEILRQRQTYQVLTEAARGSGSQVIAASHSEVVLNEAADRDVVVAFVGRPHRIDDRGSHVLKSLKEIGFDDYYQAEIAGWVLYLEGATDLSILQSLSERLEHPAREVLARPFVHYVLNQPSKARGHFFGIREAKGDLVGFSLFDHLEVSLQEHEALTERMWGRREIENYLTQPATLIEYAEATAREDSLGPLFEDAEVRRRRDAMEATIADLVPPIALRDPANAFWHTTKASDDFLDPLFSSYFERLGLPNLMAKADYHVLARSVPLDQLDPEVVAILDAIRELADRARPASA